MNISPAALTGQVQRSLRAWPWIPALEDAHGLPRWLLIAIASRETNCTNEPGDPAPRPSDPSNWPGKPNHAWSPWQIDIGSGGTPDLLSDTRRAAEIASGMLQGLLSVTGNLKCACAAYNEGLGNEEAAVAHGPAHDPDLFTTGHDYGADVLERLAWLQASVPPVPVSSSDPLEEIVAAYGPGQPANAAELDYRRTKIRQWYEQLLGTGPLGRDPESEAAIDNWLNLWASHGAEFVFTAIYDSGESKAKAAEEAKAVANEAAAPA